MNNAIKESIRHEISIILNNEPDRGIIHTVSYRLADTLRDLSPRIIIHDSENKNELYEKFTKTEGAVWVSPSSMRGLDLHDDLGRFAVILKCPYLDLGDYHTKQRLFTSGQWGQQWYTAATINNIIQACGRVVRNEDDWGRVYILDMQVGKLLEKNTILWPGWFREAVEYE